MPANDIMLFDDTNHFVNLQHYHLYISYFHLENRHRLRNPNFFINLFYFLISYILNFFFIFNIFIFANFFFFHHCL